MPRTPDDLVRMEVHYCVSFLVSTLASAANSGSGINLGDLGAVMDQAFCSGQGIASDSVIEAIAADLNKAG